MTKPIHSRRQASQFITTAVFAFDNFAVALDESAKIGVPDRNLHPHPPGVLTFLAPPGRFRGGRSVTVRRTDRNGEGREDVTDALHSEFLLMSAIPLAWCPPLSSPAFENPLDVAPGAFVIGHRLG